MRTVTVNKAHDFHRRNSVRPDRANSENVVNATVVANEVDLFEEAEYRAFLVKRGLEVMQAEFRDETWKACWKHVVDGMKAADVARESGMSINMVYLAKSRVLSRLREEMHGLID